MHSRFKSRPDICAGSVGTLEAFSSTVSVSQELYTRYNCESEERLSPIVLVSDLVSRWVNAGTAFCHVWAACLLYYSLLSYYVRKIDGGDFSV